ncbi:MAG: hypothetical protein IIT65_09185, partial [Lachnospiraceae bacterium]|nr:hypothetical protein [Lachnospiraceae bacterium]
MLKLYFPGKVFQPLDEMLLARKVYEAGIPTPEPGEYVVTEDGRYGIRFRRIAGKKSYSRATADHPERVAEYAGEFARMCLQLHAISFSLHVPSLPSVYLDPSTHIGRRQSKFGGYEMLLKYDE